VREQLEQRLKAELEAKQTGVRETLLHVSGAFQLAN
jgi:hypothetical protein